MHTYPRARLAPIVLVALLGVVTARIAAVWIGSERMLKPDFYSYPRPLEADPSKVDLAFAEVSFPTAAGATIRGWFIEGTMGTEGGVLAVHGAGANRSGFLPLLPFLNEAGYHVLAIDLRDHGVSDGHGRGLGLGYREMHDVSAAVTWLKDELKLRHVIVFGISMGAATGILAAAGDVRIDGLIADASWAQMEDVMRASPDRGWYVSDALISAIRDLTFARLGALHEPEPLDAIRKIAPRPVLLIHGSEDAIVPVEQSRRLFEAAREPKDLWIADGGGHGGLYFSHRDEYEKRVIGFLSRWLAPARRSPDAVSSSR